MPKGNEMHKLTYTIADACRLLSLGRSSLYAAINAGELEALKSGRRTLISRESLERFVADRPHLSNVRVQKDGGQND